MGNEVRDKDGKLNIQFIKGAKFTPWPLNPLLLVIHWAATTGIGCLRTFLNPEAKGSSHYIVYENGQIIQIVDERFIAWHAGESKYKNYLTKSHNMTEWNSLNPCSIGIECAGPPSIIGLQGWPDVEIQALIELCKDIKSRYPSIKITDHSTIIVPRGMKVDVKLGTGNKIDVFPWKRLIEESGIEEA